MKQPTTQQPPTENQKHLDRFYWELHHCLQENPNHRHRILMRAMKQTDALRKKIKSLYRESPD
ncbi:MAG: hypothetical protein ACFB15_31260 [Cyclobacteriaceae bacterium]